MAEDTFSLLVTEVSRALEPLHSSVASPEAAKQFLAILGWETPPGVQDIGLAGTDLSGLVDAALTLARSTDADWDDATVIAKRVADVLLELGKVIQAVTSVMNGLHSRADLPGDYLAKTHLDSELLPRLLDFLAITYLQRNYFLPYQLLKLAGIISVEPIGADPANYQTTHTRYTLRFDPLGALLAPDRSWASEVYGWATPQQDVPRLMQNIGEVLMALGARPVISFLGRPLEEAVAGHPVPQADTNPMPSVTLTLLEGIAPDAYRVGVILFEMRPSTPAASDAGLALMPFLSGTAELTLPLPTSSRRWSIVLDAAADLSAGVVLSWRPKAGVQAQAGVFGGAGAPLASGGIGLFLQYAVPSGSDTTLFTLPGGTSFALQGLKVGGGAHLVPGGGIDAFGQVTLQGGKLTISLGGADSFIGSLISANSLEVNAALSMIYSQKNGLSVTGSAGLETAISINVSVGPFQIDTLHLAFSLGGKGLALEASLDGSGSLGPISASVQRIGAVVDLNFQSGNLGPLDLKFGFRPPTGLGINIDAGPITGGGFIEYDPDAGRYAGVLALSLYSIQVKAIGLLDTKMPGGESGYSFLVIISVEFTPIQLGFGITLNGVGGLCGINRNFVTDALRAGLRQHSLDHILFPKDPVKNAPAIISDLRAIFPPAEGRYVFGPMLELGWGGGLNLVTVELGVILALPSPVVIAILGQLNVNLPNPDAAVVELHLDVLGIIDFGKKLFSLDATLYDSRIVVFTIYGDMAMRLSWGDHPSFALSIGGLNPHFQPPAGFPTLKRLTIALSATENFRLTIQTYFAITSNSFQLGAHAELYIGVSDFNVYGWLGFDALLIFEPFSFVVDFTAGLAFRSGNSTLMGISISGELSGPTPWHAKGEAHVTLLFFDIGVRVDTTWGESRQIDAPRTDAWAPLRNAIANLGNWSGALPQDTPAVVTLAKPAADTKSILLADPSGALTLRERVCPLDQTLTKFGEAVPGPQNIFSLDAVSLGGQPVSFTKIRDKFAPAQFEQMPDQDKLSRPSFEDRIAGFSVGDGLVTVGHGFGLDLAFEDVYVDDKAPPPPSNPIHYHPSLNLQARWALSNAAAKSALHKVAMGSYAPPATAAPLVAMSDESFVVATTTDLTHRADITQPTTKGEAYQALAAHLSSNPAERDQLQVLPLHELAQ